MNFLSVRLNIQVTYRPKKGEILIKILSNDKKKNLKKDSFEDAVAKACEGLFYISETDAGIHPFFGSKSDGVTSEQLMKTLRTENRTTIDEQPFAEFFSRLTKIQDWFTPVETERVKRFLKLQNLLKDNLKDITVLRIGRKRIDIFVVGVDKSGKLAGIRTMAVET